MSAFTSTGWASSGPETIPELFFDMAADCLEMEQWALKEAKQDDTHPNDAAQYEDEAAQWALAYGVLWDAGERLRAAFSPKPKKARA